MRSQRCIIFDLFGVVFSRGLAGSLNNLEAAFRRSAADVAPTYTKWEQKFDLGEINEQEFWSRINKDLGTSVDHELLTELVVSSYKIDNKVVEMVKNYRKYVEVVAYSNYRREWFNRLENRFHVSQYFSTVFISSDTGILKPSHKVFDIVSKKTNTPRGHLILVDDDPSNITSANAAGCHGILFQDVYTSDYALRNALPELQLKYDVNYAGVLLQTKDGALILQRRNKHSTVANPGRLSVFGGRQESGELSVECARRELAEETGLSFSSDKFEPLLVLSCPIGSGRWMKCAYYRVRNIEPRQVRVVEGEDAAVFWPEHAVNEPDVTDIVRVVIRKLIDDRQS